MNIGSKVKFIEPIWQGIIIITKDKEGILIERPHWYGGIAKWDYYVEVAPYIVVGVRADEIRELK